ncbi:MAG: PEGA domain-containing protein [Deltaproteobacteria bacterium]|nr:PEGA domain-containing protein [Deltaproteobacteria bacterium]
MRRGLCLLISLALLHATTVAHGDNAKRSVAIFEFRAGAQGASNVGMRIAGILRRATSLGVVDPNDARRVAGARVDEELARCRGESQCVATIGKKLAVDEVVLVGVSEFGDLILALHRIHVGRGNVMGRIAESLPTGTEPDDDALLQYLRRLLPPEDFVRHGKILVQTSLDGAKVTVGNMVRGQTPLGPVVVEAPARLDILVEKPGYQAFAARLDVPPDSTVEVRPVLARMEDPAWYRKWWVWAIAGSVVATATVTGVLMTRPAPTHAPVEIEW